MDDDEQNEATLNIANNLIMDLQPAYQLDNPENQCRCGSVHCLELNLSRELDVILNPRVIFQASSQLDKIWPLFTNRQMDVSSFLALLSEYRLQQHCSLAWPPGYVAYRCKTCSSSPTMAICADCFRAGDHSDHDYNMFKSRRGGACDCGYSIMRESGHCSRHGHNATAKRSHEKIPASIICVPARAMPRLIHRLAISLRRSHVDMGGETDIYLDYLSQIAGSSVILRDLMIDAFISEEDYSSQINLLSNHPELEVSRIINEGLKKLKRERKGLLLFKVPEEWKPPKDIKAFCDNLTHACFLEEFIFWTVVFEFPQKLVCFLLGFLMDDRYKYAFARAFVNYYPRILMMLAGFRGEPKRHLRDTFEQLSSRILHISVQFYSDAKLTKTLNEQEYTLHTIIYCLRVAIEGSSRAGLKGVLKTNPLCLNNTYAPQVACYDNIIIRDNHLTCFAHDLNDILELEEEALRFISDTNLLNCWVEMLCYFQTMNPYKRALNEHTPYETGHQVSLFTIEAEFCLSPMWSLLGHLKDKSKVAFSETLLQILHSNLCIWLHNMSIGPSSLLDPYHISFHIPIHRMFAATLRHMMFSQDKSDREIYEFIATNQSILGIKYGHKSASGISKVITTNCFFRMLLLHPLQTLTICNETRSNMWIRNGLMAAHQAVTYVHCAYCYSTIDLDMFLLKYCASKLNSNYFLNLLMSRFHAWKWLSFKSNILMSNASNDSRRAYHFNILPEQILQMVESSLLVLIQLLTLSIHCNVSEKDQFRQEIVALISVRDRSFSYLMDMLPYRSFAEADDKVLISLLDELTIYKPAQHGIGGNLQQGSYTLKPDILFNEYNPVKVQYRFNQRRDYQISLERFFQHCKLTGKLDRRYPPSTLWPPLSIPSEIGNFGKFDLSPLIKCSTLLGIVFSIIYKNLYIGEVPDAIMAYAIHLLELSLRKELQYVDINISNPKASGSSTKQTNPLFTGKYAYRRLTSCPAYFGSKGEAYIKGSTIYALFNKLYYNMEGELDGHESRVFPVVRNALDLAFESTWFPFSSVADNCLVHVEFVHSMPSKDFEILLRCPFESDEIINDQMTNESRSRSTSMSWNEIHDERQPSNEDDNGEVSLLDDNHQLDDDEEDNNDDDLDNDDDDEDDDDTDDEEEEDDDDDDDDDEDDDDDDDDDEDDDDEDDLEGANLDELGGQDVTNRREVVSSVEPLTLLDEETEDSSLSSSSFFHDVTSQLAAIVRRLNRDQPSESSTSGPNTATQNEGDHTYSSSAAQTPMEVEMELVDSLPASQSTALSLVPVHHHYQQQQQQNRNNSSGGNNINSGTIVINATPASVIEGIVCEEEQEVDEEETEQSSQVYPENLVIERRAIRASETHPMIEGFELPLALEGTSSTSFTSLIVSHRSTREAAQETEIRQPPLSDVASVLGEERTHSSSAGTMTTVEQSSLSEDDIQARFVGFFQSRLDGSSSLSASSNTTAQNSSHLSATTTRPNSRGYRQRQMARRGGYRGPVPPFVVHNPNNVPPQLRFMPPLVLQPHFPFNSSTGSHLPDAQRYFGFEPWPTMMPRSAASTAAPFRQDASPHSPQSLTAQHRPPSQQPSHHHHHQPVSPTASPLAIAAQQSDVSAPQPQPLSAHTARPNVRLGRRSSVLPSRAHSAERTSGDSRNEAGQRQQFTHTSNRRRRQCCHHHRHDYLQQQQHLRQISQGQQQQHQQTQLHLQQQQQQQHRQQKQRSRRVRKDKMHHGESLLTLLLRLHAKYSQQARSYQYDDERASSNIDARRSRIGDGVHFVTIVLDLICTLDPTMKVKLAQLRELIWGVDKEDGALLHDATTTTSSTSTKKTDGEKTTEDSSKREVDDEHEPMEEDGEKKILASAVKCDDMIRFNIKTNSLDSMKLTCSSKSETGKSSKASTSASASSLHNSSIQDSSSSYSHQPSSSSGSLNPAERRRRAKEFQSKLMAEFANKQKAFIEKYESQASIGGQYAAHTGKSCDKIELNVASSSSSSRTAREDFRGVVRSSCLQDEEPINLSSKLSQETKPAQMSDCDKQQKRQLTQEQPTEKPQSFLDDKTSCKVEASSFFPSTAFSSSRTQANGAASTSKRDEGAAAAAAREGRKGPVELTYECCICGLEGPSDLANPLGQVVLLQSTSIYGHSHLRPKHERKLPCEELQYLSLREETYAKYLERRIDLLCEHFSESSWLDSINIGAEGGVHVQSCGHYLHIECHQSYIKSLEQERPRFRNDSDEFLCPVCRQLANSVLPILSSRPGQFSLALVLSEHFNDQIKLIGSLLNRRLPPNQLELQSSASFCSHLTKATGPQYRLVRSNASMHSLFLFLTSIARTNLETEVIVRSISASLNKQLRQQQQQQQPEGDRASASYSSSAYTSSSSSGISSAASKRRSCFMLLFYVLALNAKTLINDQWFTCDQIWSHLTYRIDEKNRLTVKPTNSEVPLLLRDPTAMLLQFLFAISSSLNYQSNFTCLVQILFNLTVTQSIALVLSYVKPASLFSSTTSYDLDEQQQHHDFNGLVTQIGVSLKPLLMPSVEEPLMNSTVRNCWSRFASLKSTTTTTTTTTTTSTSSTTNERAIDDSQQRMSRMIESRVELACLPFLRASAFIQHQLYDQPYPDLEQVDDENINDERVIHNDFLTLTSFLNLGSSSSSSQKGRQHLTLAAVPDPDPCTSSALLNSLKWPLEIRQADDGFEEKDVGGKLIASWSAELLRFGLEFSIAARTLLVCRSIAWFRPSLMQLPNSFDDIFMHYYRKKCALCHQVPRDVVICLVCGAPICFRISCCKDKSRSRLVHSQHCGANTAVFLAVHTSSIVVIRGNRACVWGSVYLDAHGEEDNGLLRGKPLYLVPARFQLLEHQWLTHSFDHKYSKPWIYLQENQ